MKLKRTSLSKNYQVNLLSISLNILIILQTNKSKLKILPLQGYFWNHLNGTLSKLTEQNLAKPMASLQNVLIQMRFGRA